MLLKADVERKAREPNPDDSRGQRDVKRLLADGRTMYAVHRAGKVLQQEGLRSLPLPLCICLFREVMDMRTTMDMRKAIMDHMRIVSRAIGEQLNLGLGEHRRVAQQLVIMCRQKGFGHLKHELLGADD